MHKFFVKAWEENKGNLREYFSKTNQDEYCSGYKDILKCVVKYVFNGYNDKRFNFEDIQVVDFGDYQGTIVLFFTTNAYQPSISETYMTSVYYGSCSGCDTLLSICDFSDGKLPTHEQVDDYMELALNLVQHIKCLDGEYDELKE